MRVIDMFAQGIRPKKSVLSPLLGMAFSGRQVPAFGDISLRKNPAG
jgi:hypothetical protein